MAKYKRRLIPIIDRGFQFKYTGIIVLVAGVVSTVLGFLILSAYREMNEIIQVSEMIGQRMDADDARRVFYMVVGFLVAEVIILGLLGLLITHRICGPIFVINRNLRAIIEGRYPAVRPLRSGDEFREAFDTMVDIITLLKERDATEAKALGEIIESAKTGALSEEQIETLARFASERTERVEAT